MENLRWCPEIRIGEVAPGSGREGAKVEEVRTLVVAGSHRSRQGAGIDKGSGWNCMREGWSTRHSNGWDWSSIHFVSTRVEIGSASPYLEPALPQQMNGSA